MTSETIIYILLMICFFGLGFFVGRGTMRAGDFFDDKPKNKK